ncbi:ribosome maturation factor RimM [Azotosporobacter soli]|uniref:ribosome maturation factor RimM n=1 Tax=Azotosporobacter soli TaxID=3055040 RepID=UPI0031FF4455
MKKERIIVGQIGAPHGVKGEVRVTPQTDFPERFERLKTVYVGEGSTLTISRVRYHKQFVILKFDGLDDRDQVELLKNKLISIDKKDLMPLPDGRYYIFDIVGLEVYDLSGARLGKISEVLHTGSNDVYVVEREAEQPLLVPALKQVVHKIDLSAGRMTVELQEEWD